MDELEAALRSANRSELRRSTPLSLRAEVELTTLLAEPSEPSRARAARPNPLRMATAFSAIAITLVLATVFAITDLGRPAAPSMAAPPLLEATAIDATPAEVLAELAAKAAREGDGSASMDQLIRYEAWSIQIEIAETTTSFVQPEVIERRCASDRSGYWESRAGDVRYGVPTEDHPAAQPGDLLRRDDYRPGEFPMAFMIAPPSEPAALDDHLRASWGLTDESTAFDYFSAVEGLRLEWELSGAQTAAALEVLSARDDVSVAGRVRDRLGREGIALEAVRSDGAFRALLVFSAETGILLSSELIYLGGLPDFDLDFPTVTNYYAWKDSR